LRFDIPAAPAASAIAELSRQARINVLAAEEVVDGIVTNEVHGMLPLAEAFGALLAGTPLRAEQMPSGAIFIFRRT